MGTAERKDCTVNLWYPTSATEQFYWLSKVEQHSKSDNLAEDVAVAQWNTLVQQDSES